MSRHKTLHFSGTLLARLAVEISTNYTLGDLFEGSPCKLWSGSLHSKGYGLAYHEGKKYLTHRIAYAQYAAQFCETVADACAAMTDWPGVNMGADEDTPHLLEIQEADLQSPYVREKEALRTAADFAYNRVCKLRKLDPIYFYVTAHAEADAMLRTGELLLSPTYFLHNQGAPDFLITDVIDHRCRNRLCMQPLHLRAISNRENILAGTSPAARMAARTVCAEGHPLGEPRNGRRQCKICRNAAQRQRYHREGLR
jgi:hypothetical protein